MSFLLHLNLVISPLRLDIHKTAMLGHKSRTGARPTKGRHNFKWYFPLFVLSQCDFWFPAWQFSITRMASCKGPIGKLSGKGRALNFTIMVRELGVSNKRFLL